MSKINLYSCVFSRIFNLVVIVLTYAYSIITRRVTVAPMPFSVNIEPTNKCQLACPECPTGNQSLTLEKGKMDLDTYKKFIASIYKQVFYLNLYFQGEPLLHENIMEMIRLAKKYRMYVVLSTNAQLINEKIAEELVLSGLSKIIVSMDGMTEETYQKYRIGGRLSKVKEAIGLLNKAKKKYSNYGLKIVSQFLVNRYNEHEIIEFYRWSKKNKVKPELKSMQIYHNFNFLPDKEKYRRYQYKCNVCELKHSAKNRCFRIWKQCVVRYNGDLVPCCYDKLSEFVIGNIKDKTLRELWKSNTFNNFRLKILKEKKTVSICSNCTE